MPSARLSVAERLFEVGVDDLALSRRECEVLLGRLDVELAESDVAELFDRTEAEEAIAAVERLLVLYRGLFEIA